VVVICFSGQLAAQEQPLHNAPDAQQADAEEAEVQQADPDIDDQPAEPGVLSKKLTKQLVKKIIPAIEAGDDIAFLNAVMPVIKKAEPEELIALDELSREHGVQPIQSQFVDLVLAHTEQGQVPTRVISNLKMSMVVLDGLTSKLNEFADRSVNHAVMTGPLEVPDDFHKSERMFWDFHVLHNEFQNVFRTADLGQNLVKQHKKALKRKDEWQQLGTDLAEANDRLMDNYNLIKERAAALRLMRFEQAHDVLLNDKEADFELQLTSAMELEQDGSVLQSFLADKPTDLKMESLNAEGLDAKIKTMLKEGREAAGDVATKANLLRNGLHYWTRGRYGSGTEVFGLVKHSDSVKSIEGMESLYMPRERKQPISTYRSEGDEEEDTPGYERRHYYTWGAEYRPIVQSSSGTTKTQRKHISTTRVGQASSHTKRRFL